MEIIHVVLGKANPNRMNGVNKVAHCLATAQKELGHDVQIFGLSNSPENEIVDRIYKLKIYKRKKLFLDKELKKEIKKNNCNNTIFHIHGGFIIDFYFLSRFLFNNNFKYIFTSHGSYNEEALQKNNWQKRIFFSIFDKQILLKAWKVQFLGESELKNIDTLVRNINKVLIPNGQNLQDLEISPKVIIKNKETGPVFGFVGRIDKFHKGLDILLNGFSLYRSNGGKGVLSIVGDGPDLAWAKNVVKQKNLKNYVTFQGALFGTKKLHLISQFDVFVHTSRFEGFPMAVLEAAGLKKPLLISKETNFSSYIQRFNNGRVLLSNVPLEVKNELFFFEKIYDQNNLSSLGENSLEMIIEEFQWDRISQLLLK